MILERVQRKEWTLSTLFSWFIIYSYIGWLYETAYCSIYAGRFVNRGFLYGPICPIYGVVILLMILLLSGRFKSTLSLFFSCALVASGWEYMSSYSMEVIFGRRWWNYTNKAFNIDGRICLSAGILFGISGVLVIRYLHPAVIRYINQNFTEETLHKVNKIVLAIFLVDVIASIRMSL